MMTKKVKRLKRKRKKRLRPQKNTKSSGTTLARASSLE
jgi:hypothetical protein